jgi:cobalt/nickel transport system permease protein
MSHIHLPDGVLPFAWWFLGDLVALGWLLLALRRVGRLGQRPPLPLLGALGACMLLTMSVPLGPLPLHLNLTVLTGILAGPWLGYITVLLVTAMLSLMGHGGLTVFGINSLILGLEVSIGWWLFHRLCSHWRLDRRVLTASLLALTISITVSFSIVGWSTGLWAAGLPGHGHDLHHHSDHTQVQSVSGVPASTCVSLKDAVIEWNFLGQSGLVALGLLFSMGLLAEGVATLVIARYLQKVRPDLLLSTRRGDGR